MAEYEVSGHAGGKATDPAVISLRPVEPYKPNGNAVISSISLTVNSAEIQQLLHVGKRVEIRIYDPD